MKCGWAYILSTTHACEHKAVSEDATALTGGRHFAVSRKSSHRIRHLKVYSTVNFEFFTYVHIGFICGILMVDCSGAEGLPLKPYDKVGELLCRVWYGTWINVIIWNAIWGFVCGLNWWCNLGVVGEALWVKSIFPNI